MPMYFWYDKMSLLTRLYDKILTKCRVFTY